MVVIINADFPNPPSHTSLSFSTSMLVGQQWMVPLILSGLCPLSHASTLFVASKNISTYQWGRTNPVYRTAKSLIDCLGKYELENNNSDL